jgi:hypothetical protein
MKRRNAIGLWPGCRAGAAASVMFLVAVIAHAQVPAKAAAGVAAPLIPLSLKGPGSLTGVWSDPEFKEPGPASPGIQPAIRTADGNPVPYQPRIAMLLAQQQAGGARPIDARAAPWCMPAGIPTMMYPPPGQPLQILESPQQVTVLFGFFGTFRIIHLNRKHAPDPDPGYFGDSVGHWEGDTFVVDTIGLLDKTTLFGAPHSEDMHLVERIRRTGADTVEERITITDPKTYTRPWTWVINLKRVPGVRLKEYERRPC